MYNISLFFILMYMCKLKSKKHLIWIPLFLTSLWISSYFLYKEYKNNRILRKKIKGIYNKVDILVDEAIDKIKKSKKK